VKNNPLQFGAIGLGKRSSPAALAHRPEEGLRVVAGADPHPENFARFQQRYGGAAPRIVAEFVRYVRDGGAVETSPLAARYAVAAGCKATESLRNGSAPEKRAAPASENRASVCALIPQAQSSIEGGRNSK